MPDSKILLVYTHTKSLLLMSNSTSVLQRENIRPTLAPSSGLRAHRESQPSITLMPILNAIAAD
ncbi:hypothetical protein BM1_01359 [Bipolaris maydis]|nr:hypothetical protein BM1_01359 [Bipolaris maydis]